MCVNIFINVNNYLHSKNHYTTTDEASFREFKKHEQEAFTKNNQDKISDSFDFLPPEMDSLTQLMKGTADDEARKLKLGDDYDVLDPKTNIAMGSHYLASLIGRTPDNSVLLAMLAYNAGLTNVRKWKNANSLPMDFYVETLPFPETRGYGRKMVGAAAMYGFLYYGITPAQTVRELLYLK